MLTDAALKALKPQSKMYKVSDRDGMYVRVMPSGAISFRLDYRLHGRRETVYLGKYGRDGISLARARELCIDARRAVSEGRSPARAAPAARWSVGDDAHVLGLDAEGDDFAGELVRAGLLEGADGRHCKSPFSVPESAPLRPRWRSAGRRRSTAHPEGA